MPTVSAHGDIAAADSANTQNDVQKVVPHPPSSSRPKSASARLATALLTRGHAPHSSSPHQNKPIDNVDIAPTTGPMNGGSRIRPHTAGAARSEPVETASFFTTGTELVLRCIAKKTSSGQK